jgi:hypothetical protein
MTATEPAVHAGFVMVALLSQGTVTVENRPSAVTLKVPEPVGPVSQVSMIVTGPAAAARAVAEIAMALTPARSAAIADFQIHILILLLEQNGHVQSG